MLVQLGIEEVYLIFSAFCLSKEEQVIKRKFGFKESNIVKGYLEFVTPKKET